MVSRLLQRLRPRRARPRLLLLSPLPPPAGGIATWTKRLLASGLAERFEVRVIDTNFGTTSNARRAWSGASLRFGLRVYRQLLHQLATFRPDVVHINTSGRVPGLPKEALYLGAARASGAVGVLHFRGSRVGAIGRSRLLQAARAAMGLADQIFVLNAHERDLLVDLGIRHVTRVDNFIPHRPFQDRSGRTGPVRFLFVGWIMEPKGIFELFDAFARVPDAQLVLLGRYVAWDDSDPATAIAQRLDALGIADRVTIPGEVPLEEVWAFYEQADAFVLPSWSEGFPNALLESMMAGLPAVVTPVGAMASAVTDGETGLVVPVRDAAALGDALVRIAGSPELRARLGRAAWERANARYETEQVLGRIGDVYEGLMRAGR